MTSSAPKHLFLHEDGREISVRMSPFELKINERLGIVNACESLWSSVEALLTDLLGSQTAPEPFGRRAPFWAALREARAQSQLFYARFDFRLHNGVPQFFELNTNCPAGGVFFSEWRRRANLGRTDDSAELLSDPTYFVDRLVHAARNDGRDDPSLNVVLATDNGGLSLELPYMQYLLATQGHSARIAEVTSLSFDGRRLRASDGSPVDLVYCKCNPLQSTSPGWSANYLERCRGFLSAWRVGAVTVRNPLAAILLAEDKAFLALLAATKPEVRHYIPATKVLFELDEDELDELKRGRELWVLKPRQESRGRGVVCGAGATPQAWLSALRTANPREHVVQRFVPDETSSLESRTMTALMLEGRVVGLFNRVSADVVNNVASGGEIELIRTVC